MMGNKGGYFCYDHEHDTWRKTGKLDVGQENIPFVIIVKFFHECQGIHWEKVWCPGHQAYEEIAGYTKAGVTTTAGCELKGWQVCVEQNIYQNWPNHREAFANVFCWHLQELSEEEFLVHRHDVEIAFPFTRFFLAEKEAQAPHVIRMSSSVWRVCSPQDRCVGLPAVLRQRMFPLYTPLQKTMALSADWLAQEYQQEAAFHQSRGVRKREWEYGISGYNFRQIREERAFRSIRKHYNPHAVPEEELQHKIYFCIERNGRTMCTLAIAGDTIRQIDYSYHIWSRDEILMAKLQLVIRKWRELCGLQMKCVGGREDNRLLSGRSFHINQLPLEEPWETMSLLKMESMADDEIRPGFYLHMYRNLYATGLLFLGPLPSGEVDDIECLQEQWPFARRLLLAAAAGNPEACYVMHLIYVDGNFNLFHTPDFRRSEQWYKKAVANGWLAMAPDKDDIEI